MKYNTGKCRKRWFAGALSILSTLVFLWMNPSALATTHTKLKQLDNKIADIKASLSQDESTRSEYQQDLKKTEITAGNVLVNLKKTQTTLKKQRIVLQQLSEKSDHYESTLTTECAALAQHMRAAYLLGRQPYLKLILNQSDAARMSRILTYYHYLARDQVTAIHRLQTTLSALQHNQHDMQAQTHILRALASDQQREHDQLESIRHDRKRVIQKISHNILTKNQKLAQLLANKRLLENTIDQLDKEAKIRTAMTYGFARLKGKLAWPTKGKVLELFGTPIEQSELTWTGILIKAPEGQPVRAIAGGQVVFARWLPGYGLLLIISHGHGYMTLYGRNHYLYKKPGDVVETGDLIATVGDTGGYENPALYFAIRHNAKPLNPVRWCSSHV